MADRPYFRSNIAQLELLFEETKDTATLEKICCELRFRKTPRALSLLRKVEDSLKPKEQRLVTVNDVVEAATESISTNRPVPQASVNTKSLRNGANEQRLFRGASMRQGSGPDSNSSGTRLQNSISTHGVPLTSDYEPQNARSETVLTENHAKLLDLLDYLEHLARLGERPVYALKEYQQLVFAEADLKGRVGISHDLSSDEGQVWLRLARLQRTDPPAPPQAIRDWVAVSRDPNQFPKVQNVLTRTMPASEADELLASGQVRTDDVSPSPKLRDGKQMVDVIMRLDAQPSIKSAVTDYLSTKWMPWAEIEKPTRASIAIYDKFFSLYHSLQAEAVERPIEVVWGVGVARWKLGSHVLDHPLIEQLVEIELDIESGAITIAPRTAMPQLALKPYSSLDVEGVDSTLSFAKHFYETLPADIEFSPFQRTTFEPVLRFAATRLDSAGRYYPDCENDINDRTLPDISNTLVVTDTWAIYARPRSANFFMEDLGRLRKAVTNSADLPGPSKKLVEVPSSENSYSPTLIDITKATLGGPQSDVEQVITDPADQGELEFFFPKPFNADQVAIVQRLEYADGVVVQGPPGTGKTHTIANIICHCLATGRKVLVTSKGEAALAVLREHIPEGIRDLTISLLTSEREGLKQLERAVALLASTATQMNPRELERQILSGQQQISELKKRLASIDTELVSFAKKHLSRVPHKDSPDGLLPIELAQLLASDAERHSWLPDRLTLDPKYNPLFNDEDISGLRHARRLLGKDMCYVTANVPTLSDLPDGAQVIAIHEDLAKFALLERDIEIGRFARLRLMSGDFAERCKTLSESIKQVISLWNTVDKLPWLAPFVRRWIEHETETEGGKLFESLLIAVRDLRKWRTEIFAYAISCPDALTGDTELFDAVHRASAGGRPFGLIPFGKTQVRQHFSSIRIEGRIPNSKEDWYKVERYLVWRSKLSSTVARWNGIALECGLPNLKDQGESAARWLSETADEIDKAEYAVQRAIPLLKTELPELFPHGIDADQVIYSRDQASRAIESIEANLSAIVYGKSRNSLNGYIRKLNDSSEPAVEDVRQFMIRDVGNPNVTVAQITEKWQILCREIDRIHDLRPYFEIVKRVATLIRESGAPLWANLVLREEPGAEDHWTPDYWPESWSWVRYHSYLKEIDGRDRFCHLQVLRRKYEAEVQKAFSDVVRLRTYLGLKQNMSDQVEAALNMFMAALRHIGKGTGIRARRFRQDARNAMERSYAAVPCWIMPTWRISESLPSSLGSFDLVVIDEASQSDITALPALLRGMKVLIVGDDKQVSPTAAFVEEKKLLQLKHNYLKGQPFGPLMLPGFSLYELALSTFPGKRIMLREHFRCVEPIIRFSVQFYEEPIVPVRIAKASERLTPPLIDVYVPHGQKDKRQVNVAEAEAIVDEIEKIVKEPVFDKRTIGVVSLLAAKQAYYIQSHLIERIGEEEYIKHQITCGDSATFQGKERDIMFVSMVECPATCTTKTALLFQQRFNVALSRARDRMYLFHSVTEEMLKPEDLKARVLRHFKRPMPATQEVSGTLLEQCDSDFEREFLKRLLELGYRASPQMKVGPFSIDMVVEGDGDRRLAIELDGDKYHTPDRWTDDLGRQRVMERVGWRFWRCWGSSYLLDPEACFADLIDTLDQLEIKPSTLDLVSASYTEFRTADNAGTELKAPEIVAEETPIEVGDKVLVAFSDEPGRQHTLVIRQDGEDPAMGIYSIDHPVGKALLGAMVEDQITLALGDQVRTATVLGIEKESALA